MRWGLTERRVNFQKKKKKVEQTGAIATLDMCTFWEHVTQHLPFPPLHSLPQTQSIKGVGSSWALENLSGQTDTVLPLAIVSVNPRAASPPSLSQPVPSGLSSVTICRPSTEVHPAGRNFWPPGVQLARDWVRFFGALFSSARAVLEAAD